MMEGKKELSWQQQLNAQKRKLDLFLEKHDTKEEGIEALHEKYRKECDEYTKEGDLDSLSATRESLEEVNQATEIVSNIKLLRQLIAAG